MEIILLESKSHLGKFGDIINVKNGYARNYLIPTKKACLATKTTKIQFEKKRAILEKEANAKLNAARVQAEKLQKIDIVISRKAGIGGRLFGSVTNNDIYHELSTKDFQIAKSMIRLPYGPLKILGEHSVNVILHSQVKLDLLIKIVDNPS